MGEWYQATFGDFDMRLRGTGEELEVEWPEEAQERVAARLTGSPEFVHWVLDALRQEYRVRRRAGQQVSPEQILKYARTWGWHLNQLDPELWDELATPTALALVGDDLGGLAEEVAASHPLTPEPLLRHIASRPARQHDDPVQELLAHNPALPLDLVLRLLQDSSEAVRQAAAGNPRLPEQVLARLVSSPDHHLRVGAAEHPSLPRELGIRLAGDADEAVRMAVLEHCPLPDDVFEEVLAMMSEFDRRLMAYDRGIRPLLAERLAKDPSRDVRVAIAEWGAEAGLPLLAEDEDYDVRLRVALNPLCPCGLAEQVANGLWDLLNDGDRDLLARSGRLSHALALRLAEDGAGKAGLLRRPVLTEELLEVIARDAEAAEQVRKWEPERVVSVEVFEAWLMRSERDPMRAPKGREIEARLRGLLPPYPEAVHLQPAGIAL